MRNQFTFYRSFWEAITDLPPKKRLKIFEIICEYALDGKQPEIQGIENSVFLLIKPTLDTSARRAESGRAGGIKQSGSKTEAKRKQTAREKEREKEGEKEKENEIEVESDSLLTRAGARLLPAELPEGIESIEAYYGALPETYREPKARIALMRAVAARQNGNEEEAQRWAALATAGGLRVNTRSLTAP